MLPIFPAALIARNVQTSLTPTEKSDVLISCRDVRVDFLQSGKSTARVLNDLNLDIYQGEVLTLLGHSGCGKSTLLRAIAGLQATSAGKIDFKDSTFNRNDIGVVFQEPALLDWRNAWQNVQLPFELRKIPSNASSKTRINELLSAVSLKRDDFHKRPDQLSGGMKMRVALARALALSPRALLLDEPFAALDEVLRNQLNDLLLELWRKNNITILFVTHNVAEAIYLSHRIAIMHDGRISKYFDVPFSFPRSRGLRASTEFAQLYGDVCLALEHHWINTVA